MKIKKFEATWCGACKNINEVLSKYENILEKIDVDENPNVIDEYNINKLPTLVFEKDDVEFKRHVGSLTEQELDSYLNG